MSGKHSACPMLQTLNWMWLVSLFFGLHPSINKAAGTKQGVGQWLHFNLFLSAKALAGRKGYKLDKQGHLNINSNPNLSPNPNFTQ